MLRELPPDGDRLKLGPFEIETVPVSHSIPCSKMVVIHSPVGVVVHTADFKLDAAPPDGRRTDLGRLAGLADKAVFHNLHQIPFRIS